MIIYKLTSPLGNCYIGQTRRTIEKRWHEHNTRSANTTLYHALQKYNPQDWKVEVIETCSSLDELEEREKHWIEIFDTYNNGYNMTKGGNGWIRDTLTEEHKRNISKSLRGKCKSKETIERNRQAQLGKKRSVASIEKQIASRKRNGVISHTWTKEERQRLSAKLKLRPKYNLKRVQTPLGTFNSCSEAASAYNKSASWVTRMIIKGEFILLGD